jgi:hypothetical protein
LSKGKEQKNKKTEEKRRTITSFSFGLFLSAVGSNTATSSHY